MNTGNEQNGTPHLCRAADSLVDSLDTGQRADVKVGAPPGPVDEKDRHDAEEDYEDKDNASPGVEPLAVTLYRTENLRFGANCLVSRDRFSHLD